MITSYHNNAPLRIYRPASVDTGRRRHFMPSHSNGIGTMFHSNAVEPVFHSNAVATASVRALMTMGKLLYKKTTKPALRR